MFTWVQHNSDSMMKYTWETLHAITRLPHAGIRKHRRDSEKACRKDTCEVNISPVTSEAFSQ